MSLMIACNTAFRLLDGAFFLLSVGFSLFATLLGSISVVIAWVNGVFFGFYLLRRLRRAPSAQTRTEAKPRSDMTAYA